MLTFLVKNVLCHIFLQKKVWSENKISSVLYWLSTVKGKYPSNVSKYYFYRKSEKMTPVLCFFVVIPLTVLRTFFRVNFTENFKFCDHENTIKPLKCPNYREFYWDYRLVDFVGRWQIVKRYLSLLLVAKTVIM